MKGSISEFELGVLRARMLDAARAKARRGELRISVPIGYVRHREIGLGFDPDLQIREVVRADLCPVSRTRPCTPSVFVNAGPAVHFPRPSDGKRLVVFEWTPIRYRNVISVLKTRSMRAPMPMAKARNALRSSTNGLARVMGTPSRLNSGRAKLPPFWAGGIALTPLFNFAALREKFRSVSWVRRGKN